jgi:hypothetical protein
MKILSVKDFLYENLLNKQFRNKELLYHATFFDNLLEILEDNILYGTVAYDYGISTSRDRNYLFHNNSEFGDIRRGEAECQLILDKRKLKTKYKIKAFDWEEYKRTNNPNLIQSEDKILTGKIKGIKKYIVGIHLNKNVEENYQILLGQESYFIENNNIPIFGKNWEQLN